MDARGGRPTQTHLYRKPPKTGTYYISCFIQGCRTRKSLGTKSYPTARAVQKSIERDLLLDQLPARQRRVSIHEFEQRCLSYVQTQKRPKTVIGDRYAWHTFIERTGVQYLGDVKRPVIEGFIERLLESRLKKASVNVLLRYLSSMFSQAVA